MADELNDATPVELPEVKAPKEPEITVEIAEDTEKPGKPQLSDEEVAQMDTLPAEDEIGRYAKDAQRRIKSLHIANQEWRRRVAQSQKDMATATTLAEQLLRENQELKTNVTKSETALIEQALQRAESQLTAAKQRAFAAYAVQNHQEIIAAQEDMARYVAEADRLRLLKPSAAPTQKDSDPAPGASAAPPPATTSAPPQLTPATRAWVAKNDWFGKPGEEKMTAYAMGVHHHLAAQGVTEQNGAAYWSAIDKELRDRFPERFASNGNGDPAPRETSGSRPVTVTGATRTPAPRGPRHVVLSESEVRIARNLGLTPEQYAAQVVKEEAAQKERIQ